MPAMLEGLEDFASFVKLKNFGRRAKGLLGEVSVCGTRKCKRLRGMIGMAKKGMLR